MCVCVCVCLFHLEASCVCSHIGNVGKQRKSMSVDDNIYAPPM